MQTHLLQTKAKVSCIPAKKHSTNETRIHIYIYNQKLDTKKLLGAKGIATRSKNATRGSWPYYLTTRSKKLLGAPGIATRSKDATRNIKSEA